MFKTIRSYTCGYGLKPFDTLIEMSEGWQQPFVAVNDQKLRFRNSTLIREPSLLRSTFCQYVLFFDEISELEVGEC